MPPQHRFGLHNEKRITPTGEPSTGAKPELSVGIAQVRLRAAALQWGVLAASLSGLKTPLLPDGEVRGLPRSASTAQRPVRLPD